MTSRIRVLIVDDHPVVLQGLEAMLLNYADITIVAQATTGASALQFAEKLMPDVVLLDVRMPGSDGIAVARRLKQLFEEIKVIILTTYDQDDYLFGALEVGVDGYLLKTASPEELYEAIRKVNSGHRLLNADLMGNALRHLEKVAKEKAKLESGLTLQQLDLLELVADGATNKEIAGKMYWSEITVKRKLQDVLHKLGAADRTHAVAEAIRRGFI